MLSVPGNLVIDEDGAWLHRVCPDHGGYRFQMSNHGTQYSQLDRFFFETVDGANPAGRITNYWVFLTQKCQQKCSYCSVNVEAPWCTDMSAADFDEVLARYAGTKLTLSGGEPTMHPLCLEFFRAARQKGVTTQIATNGLRLSDPEFCAQLKSSGVSEVRLSFEYWEEHSTDDCAGTVRHRETKRRAVENCLEAGLSVILSPTIMKGHNENTLIEALQYAAGKTGVKELSVNGFSWNGSGTALDKRMMIMPDEMVDIIHKAYGGDRDSYYTLAKAMFAALHLLNIRLCLYTQVLLFVRSKGALRPINEFLNMRRMKRGIAAWSRFARLPRPLSLLCFSLCMMPALSMRSLGLIPALTGLLVSNLVQVKIYKYPDRLLPVVLNTNCSPLNADEAVVPRCMSGNLFMIDGTLTEGVSSLTLRNRVPRGNTEPST